MPVMSSDPAVLLTLSFRNAIIAAFGEEQRDVDPVLHVSQHADYQADVAMALAKKLGKPPREVAAAIVQRLSLEGIAGKVEIAGAGFINVTLADAFLTGAARTIAADERLGIAPAAVQDTVVVDYSSPNVAKEMHVGNMRSTIIGDCLVRVLEALGHRVIRQNHVGDWGTPFGMLIEHLLDLGEAGARELGLGDLNAFYREARKKFDADEAFADRSRRRVVLLQSGDPSTLAHWKILVEQSARYFGDVYTRLGVRLLHEDIVGESFYNHLLAPALAELEAMGLAVSSDGALCVFPRGFAGRDGAPLPLIVRKQDGGYGYATTDLAAIKHRTGTLGATRLLYVVGAPQAQHLGMVFATARLAGWLVAPAEARHVAFGSVLGPDRKMLKTREGDAVKLTRLIDEAIERAGARVLEKNPDLPADERADLARKIGIGAMKYADLSNDRRKDYVFDWNRMLAFEGNTAAYVMYCCARSNSIFRKGAVDQGSLSGSGSGSGSAADLAIEGVADHALAAALLRFGSTVRHVAETLEPHHLCGYLFEVAGLFATFYQACPVLQAEGATRRSRLALCELTAQVLGRGLDLLGIEAPARM
jgi:arginyl-tRNA synthetase